MSDDTQVAVCLISILAFYLLYEAMQAMLLEKMP